MIVLIDAGNTRLKVAILHAGRAGAAVALDSADPAALERWLGSLPAPPQRALGSNVAGLARAKAIESALGQFRCVTEWVRPRKRALGLTSRYTDPSQLGPDRWAAMLGVMGRSDTCAPADPGMIAGPVCNPGSSEITGDACAAGTGSRNNGAAGAAIDAAPGIVTKPATGFLLASFGTATTLDCVSADGVFEGGAILPGPAMMRAALAAGTAALPLAQGPAVAFPLDTQQAITTGVAAAQAGAVLRQWLAALQRFGAAPRLYVTGGGWPEVQAETRRLLAHAAAAMNCAAPQPCLLDHPVLDGLARLATQNDQGAA